MFSRASPSYGDGTRESDPLIGGGGFGRSDAHDAARAGQAAGIGTGSADGAADDGFGLTGPAPQQHGDAQHPQPHQGSAPGAQAPPYEMDFLRPSCGHVVESAEEILQAVEAQMDQSPLLLSRRGSVALRASGYESVSLMSAGAGAAGGAGAGGGGGGGGMLRGAASGPERSRTMHRAAGASAGVAAGAGGWGPPPVVGSPPRGYLPTFLAGVGVGGGGMAIAMAPPSLPAGSSIAPSTTSRASSLGGAPGPLHQPLPTLLGMAASAASGAGLGAGPAHPAAPMVGSAGSGAGAGSGGGLAQSPLAAAVGSAGSGTAAAAVSASLLEQYLQQARAAAAAAAAEAAAAGSSMPEADGAAGIDPAAAAAAAAVAAAAAAEAAARDVMLATSASFSTNLLGAAVRLEEGEDAAAEAAAAGNPSRSRSPPAATGVAGGGGSAPTAPRPSAGAAAGAAANLRYNTSVSGTGMSTAPGGLAGPIAAGASAAAASAAAGLGGGRGAVAAGPTGGRVPPPAVGGGFRGGAEGLSVRGGTRSQGSMAGGGGAGVGEKSKLGIAGVRTWLKVLPDGSASIVQLDRAALGLRYGVQLRDFRVLDPVLGATYPACLLCREGALIVNLDHIKMIVTAEFALVNHSDSDKARPFTEELKRRLQQYAATKAAAEAAAVAAAAAAAAAETAAVALQQHQQQQQVEQQHQQQQAEAEAAARHLGASGVPELNGLGPIAAAAGAGKEGSGLAIHRSSSTPAFTSGALANGAAAPQPHADAAAATPQAAAAAAAGGLGTPTATTGGLLHPFGQVASALLSILPARLNSQQHQQQHQQHQHQQGAHGSGSGSGKAGTAGATGLPAHLASHLARHPHSGLMPHHGLALPPLPAGLVGLAGLGGLGAGGGGGGSMSGGGGGGGPGGGESGAVSELVASMPFELRALEVVLEQTVSLLDAQATELERATRLALDELTLRVNPRNLERMRHLKGRMAALDNKVDTVRGVLEKLLDDDREMADMNLTARKEEKEEQAAAAEAMRQQQQQALMMQQQQQQQQQALMMQQQQQQQEAAARAAEAQSPPLAPNASRGIYPLSSLDLGGASPHHHPHPHHHPLAHHHLHPPDMALGGGVGLGLQGPGASGHYGHLAPPPRGGSPTPLGPPMHSFERQTLGGGGGYGGGGEGGGGGGGGGFDPDSEEVAVVEMLLEAYFMQLGHTWQRLQSLRSYIDSTEDLINLELDQQRNNLISVDLMVTFGSFLLTAMSVIAGLFGMNVTNRMETDYASFLGICIGSASAAVGLWLLFVYGSIRYGLMNGLSMTWR